MRNWLFIAFVLFTSQSWAETDRTYLNAWGQARNGVISSKAQENYYREQSRKARESGNYGAAENYRRRADMQNAQAWAHYRSFEQARNGYYQLQNRNAGSYGSPRASSNFGSRYASTPRQSYSGFSGSNQVRSELPFRPRGSYSGLVGGASNYSAGYVRNLGPETCICLSRECRC